MRKTIVFAIGVVLLGAALFYAGKQEAQTAAVNQVETAALRGEEQVGAEAAMSIAGTAPAPDAWTQKLKSAYSADPAGLTAGRRHQPQDHRHQCGVS